MEATVLGFRVYCILPFAHQTQDNDPYGFFLSPLSHPDTRPYSFLGRQMRFRNPGFRAP